MGLYHGVDGVDVHCHVGSLEICHCFISKSVDVHCHVGSLEIRLNRSHFQEWVHCHVGSLEIVLYLSFFTAWVHCHVGSLEKYRVELAAISQCSLPCRQLRNETI